ncbi:hypothetical protein ACFV2N_40130, partial [Streptomyces sp. NPDC059680]|uniref:hypothetical protein n=1 Tax=Streptomyces sp. NPDC059680 TaxID=3346904 RepID=UPI0036C8E06F
MPAYGRPPAYAQPVLRILDARTGEPVTAAPARRGLTRIEAHASGPDPTALRVLLTADLLVRALELGGTPVWPTLAAPHSPTDLRTAAATLAIRPFEDARDVASGLGEAQTLHVTAELPDGSGGGPVVWVAAVEWRGEPAGGQGTDLVEGHARASAPGHVPEPAPGHARESGPGHVPEPAPGHARESGPGHVPEPAPGHARESGPGHVSEPAPGHARES